LWSARVFPPYCVGKRYGYTRERFTDPADSVGRFAAPRHGAMIPTYWPNKQNFAGTGAIGTGPISGQIMTAQVTRLVAPGSAQITAWIEGTAVAPFLHQAFELRVTAVRQHVCGRQEQFAVAPSRFGQALALEAEGAAARGIFRDRQFDRALQRGHAPLAAQNRLIKRDGQVESQVTAVDLEERMRRDVDGDQEVAGPVVGHALALPPQPDLLTLGDTSRNLDVELLAS